MADTTPDISHVDQISLIIRYVDGYFDIQERLVMISEIKDETSTAFAQKVISMLHKWGMLSMLRHHLGAWS